MRKLGFTLAEVLITLGIIGVIATLTLPSLMTNTAEREYATAWKKAISALTEAVQMNMAMDNINFDDLIDESDKTDLSKEKNTLYALICNRMQTERFAKTAEDACDLALTDKESGEATGCLGYGGHMDGNVAMFFRDGSALIYPDSVKVSDETCYDASRERDVECFKLVYDINGTKKPNMLANCSADKGKMTTTDGEAVDACNKETFIARDQYPIKLYGMGAYPNSKAGHYLFDRK